MQKLTGAKSLRTVLSFFSIKLKMRTPGTSGHERYGVPHHVTVQVQFFTTCEVRTMLIRLGGLGASSHPC